MINIFTKYSLRIKLVLLYSVLLIFSVGIVGYYSYWSIWQLLISNKTSHIRARSKPIIEHWLTKNAFITSDSTSIIDSNTLELAYDLTSRDAVAIILNPKGKVIANGKRLPEEMTATSVNSQYFQQAVSGKNEISYLSVVNGKRILVLLIPIRPKPGNKKILGVIQISTSLSNINKIILRHGARLITLMMIILIIGITFGYWFIGISLKELQNLSKTCKEISKGNFTQRAKVKNRKDEIGKLADSFNFMIDKLENLIQSQKRFVANAAHELLTPLTGLRGSLEVLLRGGQDDQKTVNRLSKGMYKEVNHLIRLCDQLLGMSILQNTTNISKKQIVFNKYIDDFQQKAKYITPLHSFIIIEGPYLILMADPDLLEQILFNLLSNAIRYSPPGTSITLGWKLIPGYVEIYIADQGKGMDTETLQHAFEPFYRGRNQTISYEKGSGLGLALTKSMIEAHGGSIRIESRPGKGTTVFFMLPLIK